ncbi:MULTISPECIES: hypothetical protein [unclassified Lysobacter]|uniref:hypothetical protein n=1 Tax=unclassified Lysobacter TaxID=2635362 RepID=UPI001BE67D3F|nr:MULTISPECIES: hypothetical protein [unclassified Lysobacter]MBT2748198.1 hypothetical protein [Lysobacter sp. ISL-42]MBT2753868.1 hypothetical protein [Lysobacter sp. ISL-50]MBT2778964.1 hypothetical protein [Lysobacter sp. ISL-54]MBT2783815.1 hypothetical protein [Lysobacter sp. ISL-52]
MLAFREQGRARRAGATHPKPRKLSHASSVAFSASAVHRRRTVPVLPLVAGATPPPDVQTRKAICSGAYAIDLKFDFGDAGINSNVRATADLEPSAFSPPPPGYALYVDVAYKASTNAPWQENWAQITDVTENGYPAQPVSKFIGGWKGPTCELRGVVVASVGCPDGTWLTKPCSSPGRAAASKPHGAARASKPATRRIRAIQRAAQISLSVLRHD